MQVIYHSAVFSFSNIQSKSKPQKQNNHTNAKKGTIVFSSHFFLAYSACSCVSRGVTYTLHHLVPCDKDQLPNRVDEVTVYAGLMRARPTNNKQGQVTS